jgi:ribosomal-protein-serine acetyltransferase
LILKSGLEKHRDGASAARSCVFLVRSPAPPLIPLPLGVFWSFHIQTMTDTLTDGFVLLRRYQRTDINEVYPAVRESITDLSPWLEWCDENYSKEDAEQFIKHQSMWWEKGEVYNFAITDYKTRIYCGGCLFNHINRGDRYGNLAYWVRSSRIGEGIAAAASKLVANYGFEYLGLNRVEIVIALNNIPSIRVAEKVGATREGTLRNRIQIRDRVYDAVIFSLVPGDL